MIRLAGVAAMLAVAALLSACGGGGPPAADDAAAPPPPITVISLNQGWTDQTRQSFWFTSQGSQILPYNYFLALETAASTQRFASAANLAAYRYLPAAVSAANPDGLPIGFMKTVDANTGAAWFGIGCAACHTSQINYQNTGFLIDGAGTLADFNTWFSDLASALNATLQDSAKFGRFATTILGPGYTPAQAQTLQTDLVTKSLAIAERVVRNTPPTPAGFGRLDAFGVIFNEVAGNALGVPANIRPPNAPVSYPFLWTTGQLDLVQWNGFGINAGVVGPLTRNIGEVIGVFGHVDITPAAFTGYPSTIAVANLGDLEAWVNTLLSPQWPGTYLPPIDVVKAANGQPLYNQYCASCHTVIDRTNTQQSIAVTMTPVTEVQTDPTMAVNSATRTGQTGILQGYKEFIYLGDVFGPVASAAAILTNSVIGVLINNPFQGIEAAIAEYMSIQNAKTFNPESYKARPLNGIWATAPFLHNGSVPSLAQLLLPPAQRVKTFYLGSREYDPVNVGFVTTQTTGAYLFDTTVAGNSNAGHAYGTDVLTATQRLDLLEYLKTL
ncbi:MAG: di-heme-cytochrome C peroxidase [Burkholderiales bacterium]